MAKLAGAPKNCWKGPRNGSSAGKAEQRRRWRSRWLRELTVTPVAAAGAAEAEETQLSFLGSIPDPVTEKLRNLDLMNTTPSEALRILEELKEHI